MPFRLLPHKSAGRWLGSETQLELEKHFTIQRKLGKGRCVTAGASGTRQFLALFSDLQCDPTPSRTAPAATPSCEWSGTRRAADASHVCPATRCACAAPTPPASAPRGARPISALPMPWPLAPRSYQVRRHEDGQLYALKVCDVKSLGREEQKDVVNEVR